MAEKQNKDEQIGFHKGSLDTLAKERTELARILTIVEQLIQFHAASLKELGVDVEAMVKEAEKQVQETKEKKKPIEDIL